LARRIVAVCGDQVINFLVIITVAQVIQVVESDFSGSNVLTGYGILMNAIAIHIRTIDALGLTDTGMAKTVRLIYNLKKSQRDRLTRAEILEMARQKGSDDPRDKIYGLYGILLALGVPVQPPDYEKDIVSLYIDETRDAIKQENNLDVFYSIRPSRNTAYLPSWVPDWSDTDTPACSNPINCAASGNSEPSF